MLTFEAMSLMNEDFESLPSLWIPDAPCMVYLLTFTMTSQMPHGVVNIPRHGVYGDGIFSNLGILDCLS